MNSDAPATSRFLNAMSAQSRSVLCLEVTLDRCLDVRVPHYQSDASVSGYNHGQMFMSLVMRQSKEWSNGRSKQRSKRAVK